MKPVVSVITSNYNQGRFLAQSIESVLAQTYEAWELILVDDGSTDDSWQIMSHYAASDPRIRAFRQDHRGMWHRRDTYSFALEQSTGEIIGFLDADDTWMPDRLSVQLPFHLHQSASLSFSQVLLMDAGGNPVKGDPYPSAAHLATLDARGRHLSLLRGEYFIPNMTILLTRERLDALGGFFQPSYLPDFDYPTWLRLGAKEGFAFLPNVTGRRRLHGNTQATWTSARDLARGVFRYATEVALDLGLGATEREARSYVMSPNRRGFLADASYRSGALAGQDGDFRTALAYGFEIARLGRLRMFVRYLAMLVFKLGRRLMNSIDGIIGPRGREGAEDAP